MNYLSKRRKNSCPQHRIKPVCPSSHRRPHKHKHHGRPRLCPRKQKHHSRPRLCPQKHKHHSRRHLRAGNALQQALVPLGFLALNQIYGPLRRGTRKGQLRKTSRKAYKKRGGTRRRR